ncbi:uncharacterized protein LOC114269384 [Camellia sinensis]|uniref:uncharacterized protein LOC114269384 n=1 Tax=Camellia sinensis TaxID=4442 RepID=UPI001036EB5A|nr:uncharacterized protein LOC114269384 [Camellia sinensis]
MDYNANDRDQICRAYLQKDVKVIALSNAPQNLKLTSHDIQKDIVNVAAFETINVIIRDLGDALFSILIDEARDISINKQMAIVIRYVDKKCQVIEHFLGLQPRIMDYNANDRDQIRRAYLQKDVKVIALSNAPQNLKLTSHDIQKNIINVAAFETINVIIRDLGDALFSILIDEARDISINKQMAIVIRYVDKKCQVIEHFLGIEHVVNMNALSLKQVVENLFSKLELSISRLRSHEYDAAIVAMNHNQIALLFTLVSNAVNVIGASLELMVLNEQLDTYIIDMLSSSEFSMLNGIADLAKKMIETRRDKVYTLVYLLLTLVLILLVATAIVERAFSAMNIVKNWLRNRMGDE